MIYWVIWGLSFFGPIAVAIYAIWWDRRHPL